MHWATLLIPAALLLAACDRNLSDANLEAVKPDMTFKEVESILGQPTQIEASPELKKIEVTSLPVTRYVYEHDGRKVQLTFVGDRLATGGVSGSFDK